VVREPGEPIGDNVALAVCATSIMLYGDGATLQEARTTMAVPTYSDARKRFQAADQYLQNARESTDPDLRHIHYRTAFNMLFDAGRIAAMVYLVTEETRWGNLRRRLPKQHSNEFRKIVDTLHITYFYRGEYPRHDADGEFHHWRDRVSRFIDALEQESQERRA